MVAQVPCPFVKDPERLAKKRREAKMLRGLPPERTLAMGFQLTPFARMLAEAADRARG